MSRLRAIVVAVALVGLVGCGGKPAAPPVETAKPEAPATKQNEPPQVETPTVKAPKTEPVVETPAKTEPPKAEPAPVAERPKSEPVPVVDPPKAEAPKASSVIKETKAGEVRDDNGLKMALVWCPPGEFLMGSTGLEPSGGTDEDPVSVTLTEGYWLGQTEVTQGQWKSLMGTEPWKGEKNVKEGPTVAATHIGWDDAVSFCRKLTERERSEGRLLGGLEYRLPTEAEWERACRAGTKTAYSFGADASQLSDHAWWGGFLGDGNTKLEQYAHEVQRKKPNAWGLFDMHGNVWEWCGDWYGKNLAGGQDPKGPVQGQYRVRRGGSWFAPDGFCRSAKRFSLDPEYSKDDIGFRVALAPVRAAKTE